MLAESNRGVAVSKTHAYHTQSLKQIPYARFYVTYENQTIAVDGIEVQALASLQFKNSTIYTAFDNYNNIAETKWYINRKGKIELHTTTVGSGCPQKWYGIEVDGSNISAQTLVSTLGMGNYYSQQEFVLIGNNSAIGDAYKSVYLKHGGVVNVIDSYFYNIQYSGCWKLCCERLLWK